MLSGDCHSNKPMQLSWNTKITDTNSTTDNIITLQTHEQQQTQTSWNTESCTALNFEYRYTFVPQICLNSDMTVLLIKDLCYFTFNGDIAHPLCWDHPIPCIWQQFMKKHPSQALTKDVEHCTCRTHLYSFAYANEPHCPAPCLQPTVRWC